MVTVLAVWMVLSVAQGQPAPSGAADHDASAAAAKALADGGYPWYDAEADAVAPVQPPWTPSWWDRIPDSLRFPSLSAGGGWPRALGNIIVFLVLVLALAALIAGLVWAYR